ncbi:MAG: NfeD family protein [Planctomycetota bacterium]|nr:NfeD family protein [Planctomycetota bacterium]
MVTKSMLRILWLCWTAALLAGCGGPVSRVDWSDGGAQAAADREPDVLVVSLTGKLGTTELARCHRALRVAEERGCSYVVFRLTDAGSIGEDQGDLQSLFDRMQASPVATVAVLRGRVTQGAAALALVADQAFCLAGVAWGEVEDQARELEDYLTEDPDSALNVRLDALREIMQARLDARKTALRGDAAKLALAMVDPRVQLLTATVREGGLERQRVLSQDELTALQKRSTNAKLPSTQVFGEARLTRPLSVDAQMAETYGLSSGTLQGQGQLADVLAIDLGAMGELSVNWAERMVAWLELLQPFLLAAGFLLLLVEVKTPGTGLPGALGCVFLGLALFYSYLVGLAEVTEILVFFFGIAAIAVEIFLLPGTIIFGVVGFLCLMVSLVLSQQSFVLPTNAVEENVLLWNLAYLVILFTVVGVAAFLTWRLLPHVPVLNRMMLAGPNAGGAPESNSEPSDLGLKFDGLVDLVGRVGVAATVLRPTGAMELGEQRVDVVTEGEFLEAGQQVRVLYVRGNRVVVGAVLDDAEGPSDRAGEAGSVGLVFLLVVVGLLLIFLEVLFVSMGALGIGAAGCLLGSIFLAFQESVSFGVGVTVFEALAAPTVFYLSFKILPKTPFGKHLILSGPPTDGTAAAADDALGPLQGKRGVTLSPLRPSGFARIDGRKVDVVTRGEMIDDGVEVSVIDVSGNRVVVAQVKS